MRARLSISAALGLTLLTILSSSVLAQQDPPTAPVREREPLTFLPASVLDAELKSARGRSFKLSDYSGKVVVINLWATWLGPSRLEIPELVKLQAHFWSRGVRVVGLSTEDPANSSQEVGEFVRNNRIQYKVGWATPAVAVSLMQGRDAIPQTYVISRTGRIVKRFIGFNPQVTPGLFREAVQTALAEKPNAIE